MRQFLDDEAFSGRHLHYQGLATDVKKPESPSRPRPEPSFHLMADEETGPLIVSLSISGMTCSSCVNAITENVSRLSGISDTRVNLLQGSATVAVTSRKLVDAIRETIEDSGFGAQVIDVTSLHRQEQNDSRTVSLRVDGILSQ